MNRVFKNLILRYVSGVEEKKLSVKQKLERKHNFEVENEITYGESIVNISRSEILIPFVILQSMLHIWFW